MDNGYRYEAASWQGLIQQIVYLLSRGYHYYCVVTLPHHKKNRWHTIDQKLIQKYRCDKSKFTKARLKNKGKMNFHYLRWESVAVILRTEGSPPTDITIDDVFLDARVKPLCISISDLSLFRVYRHGGRWTVCMSRDTYQGVKAELADLTKTRNIPRLIAVYHRLNGYPAWAGIIHQKRLLAQYVCREAAKHQVRVEMSDLRITDQRRPVKVWKATST